MGVRPGPSSEILTERLNAEVDVLNEIHCTISQNNLNNYQIEALRTSNKLTPEQLVLNGVLGLNGESGEIADMYKKSLFQGHEFDEDAMALELGDVLWYIAICAAGLGISLSTIATLNINKLQRRYPDGFDSEKSKNRL